MQGKYYCNEASRRIFAIFLQPFLIGVFYKSRVEDHHLDRNQIIYEIDS